MIKKDITFTNLDNQKVTKAFYFNYTKLEGAEIELEYGDLEQTIEELNNTEDVKKAYRIFKEIIVGAVGIKSADGNEFDKSESARKAFVNSPAMSELIWSFLENPESAGPFLEGMLPAEEVEAGRQRLERQKLEAALTAQATPKDHQKPAQIDVAPPVLENEDPIQVPRTDEEILAADVSSLTNEELQRLLELRQAAQN